MSKQSPIDIECPVCAVTGQDCEHCDDGQFTVSECPSRYIGQELIADLEIVTASKRHLPVAGGLLDQSAWWFELRQLLEREELLIQAEQQRRT